MINTAHVAGYLTYIKLKEYISQWMIQYILNGLKELQKTCKHKIRLLF